MSTPIPAAAKATDLIHKFTIAAKFKNFGEDKQIILACAIIHCEGVIEAFGMVKDFKPIMDAKVSKIEPTADNAFLIGESTKITAVHPIEYWQSILDILKNKLNH